MQYYIRIRGKEFGPFGEDQLKKMRVNGKLSRTTEVSENKAEWFPAENLEFLFSMASALPTSLQITSSDNTVYSLTQSLSPEITTHFRTKLPFIAICFFLLLIIAMFGLVGFIILTKDKEEATSNDSK
jgi:hypothetical protein